MLIIMISYCIGYSIYRITSTKAWPKADLGQTNPTVVAARINIFVRRGYLITL